MAAPPRTVSDPPVPGPVESVVELSKVAPAVTPAFNQEAQVTLIEPAVTPPCNQEAPVTLADPAVTPP